MVWLTFFFFFFTVMVLKQYTLSRNCTQNCILNLNFFSRASDMWYNTLSCNAGQGILGDWAPSKPVNHCCSVAQLCPTLCNPMDCSMPGFHVLHHLPELAHTHVHWVSDVIQPSSPLSSPSPPTFNLSQHQGLFQWVSSSHQVAKIVELQLQRQSFLEYSGLKSQEVQHVA